MQVDNKLAEIRNCVLPWPIYRLDYDENRSS